MNALRSWSFRRVLLLSAAWILLCLVVVAALVLFQFSSYFMESRSAGSAGMASVSLGISDLALTVPVVPPIILTFMWAIARWLGRSRQTMGQGREAPDSPCRPSRRRGDRLSSPGFDSFDRSGLLSAGPGRRMELRTDAGHLLEGHERRGGVLRRHGTHRRRTGGVGLLDSSRRRSAGWRVRVCQRRGGQAVEAHLRSGLSMPCVLMRKLLTAV